MPERTPRWSPQHLDHEPRLGIAFVAATAVLLAAAAALTYRPDAAMVRHATTLVLTALIGAYAVNVATDVPWLSDGPESVDLVGLATKSVEGTRRNGTGPTVDPVCLKGALPRRAGARVGVEPLSGQDCWPQGQPRTPPYSQSGRREEFR